jgi:site-specific DNA recombinase
MVRTRKRGLDVGRMSRLRGNDASESIGLNRRIVNVEAWAAGMGIDIVDRTQDTDVSGDTDPFARGDLGNWLNNRADEFDVLLADDIERLGRNARHLYALRNWCDDTGHGIEIGSPPMSWPPAADDPVSPMMWDLVSRMAEWELKRITDRNRKTQQYIKSQGYLSGRPPYGTRATQGINRNGTLKGLEQDPVTAPIVREMVDRYLGLNGQLPHTLKEIADWLNSEGIAAPNRATKKHPNPRWHAGSVGDKISTISITGRHEQKVYEPKDPNDPKKARKVVATHTVRFQGIITVAEHKAILAKMAANGHRRGVASGNKRMLSNGILICDYCGGNLSPIKAGDRGRQTYLYYYCRNTQCPEKPRVAVPLMMANAKVQWFATERLGDTLVTRSEIRPGKDYEDEIDQLKLDYAAIDPEDDVKGERAAAIRAEIAHLRSLPVEEPTTVRVSTGVYVADIFADANEATQQGILWRSGIRFRVRKDNGDFKLDLVVDPEFVSDIADRLMWETQDLTIDATK